MMSNILLFYNYLNLPQLTPGMETHVNAIQTILHNNYINVIGEQTTRIFADRRLYPAAYFFLILILCLGAFFIINVITINPIIGGFLVIFECILYWAFSCGMFSGDIFGFLNILFLLFCQMAFMIFFTLV